MQKAPARLRLRRGFLSLPTCGIYGSVAKLGVLSYYWLISHSLLTGYEQEYLKLLRLKGEVPVGRRGLTSEGTYVLQSYSLLM